MHSITGDRSDGRHLRHLVCYIREPTCQPCRDAALDWTACRRAGACMSTGVCRLVPTFLQCLSASYIQETAWHRPTPTLPHSDRCRIKRGCLRCLLHPQRPHRTQGRGLGRAGQAEGASGRKKRAPDCSQEQHRRRKRRLASLGHTLVMGLHLACSQAL